METSIIIRTKNEDRWLGECLKRLSEQTYKNFEIVFVDSGSTDKTLEIIKGSADRSVFPYEIKLLHIKPEDFSYPYALNYGCGQASAKKYFVFLSGHSLPVSKTWLEDGIRNFKSFEKLIGVYGFVWALPDGTLWEKFIFNKTICTVRNIFKKQATVNKVGMGVLGFTNAIVRRDLWHQRRFNEAYGLGGEDGEWADYWFKKGYQAVRDIKFSVYHSHRLGYKELKAQWKYWASLYKPHPFQLPDFRK